MASVWQNTGMTKPSNRNQNEIDSEVFFKTMSIIKQNNVWKLKIDFLLLDKFLN